MNRLAEALTKGEEMKIKSMDLYPVSVPLREPSWVPEFREGIIAPTIPDRDVMLQPLTAPGLGFAIAERLLRKYGTRFYRVTETHLKFKVIREKALKEALALKKRKETSRV
jgi:hypothetical protein